MHASRNFSTNCMHIHFTQKMVINFCKIHSAEYVQSFFNFELLIIMGGGRDGRRLKIIVMMASNFYCEGNFLYTLRGLELQVRAREQRTLKISWANAYSRRT